MSHPRPRLKTRPRFFVGCEGESERSYVRLISSLAEQQGLLVHLEAVIPGSGGGNPAALLSYTLQEVERKERQKGRFRGRALFLDEDNLPDGKKTKSSLAAKAQKSDILLVWQSPCHEAFLLRHLEDCQALLPPTAKKALQALEKQWPGFAKNMNAASLASRLDADAVRRAARAEEGLRRFLELIGFR